MKKILRVGNWRKRAGTGDDFACRFNAKTMREVEKFIWRKNGTRGIMLIKCINILDESIRGGLWKLATKNYLF